MEPPLIKLDGEPFSPLEIRELAAVLDGLSLGEKQEFLSANSDGIATSDSPRMLVVSGPGTGKSSMFKTRLKFWLARQDGTNVSVATFVRKLVGDLELEIDQDTEIDPRDKKRVTVSTLHRLARSIVERNGGTKTLPLQPHCLMAASDWQEELLWDDVFCFHPDLDPRDFPWSTLRDCLYNDEAPDGSAWIQLRETHLLLQKFYNAVTFPDSVLLASQALTETPSLGEHTSFIIDEFQDFNRAEDRLIRLLTARAPSVLLVGDDDQVLYDQLRQGSPAIIRQYYEDREFTKAILPYCVRCGFHICRASSAFLEAGRPVESIVKVFAPYHERAQSERVKVVASTTPSAGVDYIERFLKTHADAIQDRQARIEDGSEKDAYLLILTPARRLGFLNVGGARERLHRLLDAVVGPEGQRGDDYWMLFDYYKAGTDPNQNYLLRKVLKREGIDQGDICRLLHLAFENNRALTRLDDVAVKDALTKCAVVRTVLEDQELSVEAQVEKLTEVLPVARPQKLLEDLERFPLTTRGEDDQGPFLGQGSGRSAVELVTMMGSKGLSADHVIVLGCDSVNLARVTRNTFFVAMTRGRQSLTLMACVGGGGAALLHDFVMSLPDDHVDAVQAKAGGVVVVQPTLAHLQKQLEKARYARTRAQPH